MKMVILIITTVLTALTAGLLFNWSNAILPGLKKVSDTEFISVMQSINRSIQNPLFLVCFIGPVLLIPFCAYLNNSGSSVLVFRLLLSASLLYIIGVFGVTAVGNIPLNNTLDSFDAAGASAGALTQKRKAFIEPWTLLHTARTLAAVATLVLLILACIEYKKP